MIQDADRRYMALALSLGRRGMGQVGPWPSVGCVIVKDGRIVGRGRSDAVLVQHAEVGALQQAGAAAKGATAYVTLEPCSHQGRTPPCANALIDAGVARVVVATGDPNPLVAGEGLARLRAAGVIVDLGCLEDAARDDHAGFLLVQTEGRPFVTLKLAMSLDGRIATATGESKWITGPEARRAVQALRARHDAVMVGAGTARADDPMLTVRDMGAVRQPVRVVVSRRLDLPVDSALVRTADTVPLWLCHDAGLDTKLVAHWTALGATCLPCDVYGRQVTPASVLRKLAAKGITRVFCEGGGSLASSLLAAGLVDELIVFAAGTIIGAEGTPGVAAMGLDRLSDAPRFQLAETRAVGADTLQRWRRR